ncbi:restriction endonuclease subunit S [Camelimonas fluminis]|uniref:Restriction endonuclease subunit S n=1 Tax=Camelimonas fluminis TaxID=1576911 RepID=A0ABV7UNX7_9HYPH|nr:restriction endonuclease subunit S [Camelimonas fluminis]
MPKDWSWSSLGDQADLLTGFPFRSEEYSTNCSAIRLLRGDNVVQGGIRWKDAKRWPLENLKHFARFELEVGDLVIAMDRTWIEAGLKVAPIGEQDTPSLLVQRVARVRSKAGFSQAYLRHLVRSFDFESYVKQAQTATAVPHISPTDIREYRIPVPPRSEQRRIASVLDAWDQALEQTERLILAKRRRKTAWVQKLFGNLPKRPLLEAADVWFSGVDKKARVGEAAVRLCNYMDVFHNSRITSKLDFMRATASPSQIVSNSLRKHDVVFTKDSETSEEIAQPALIAEDIDDLVCGYHLAIARPRDEVGHGPFIAQAMRHPSIRWQFSRLANGVVRFGLTLDAIEQAEIFLPSLDVQERIAAVLDAEDLMIEDLSARAELFRTQKRGLMQKLLTGEWRLGEKFE